MYLYKFNKKELNYRKIWVPSFYLIPISIVIFAVLVFTNGTPEASLGKKMVEYEDITILINTSINEKFSPKELYTYIKELNIKCPKIVMCQAINETRFCSTVFKENHNIFNMKAARLRPNTQVGFYNNHAVYSNWKQSVLDYAMWQAYVITPEIKTDEQYFDLLVKMHYAESEVYISALKNIYNNFDKTLETYQNMWEKGTLHPTSSESNQKTDSLLNK